MSERDPATRYQPPSRCCWQRTEQRLGRRQCGEAPLCSGVRVTIGADDRQGLEVGWGPNHAAGRLVLIHVHETGLPPYTVDVPMELLLGMWAGEASGTCQWHDQRTKTSRTSYQRRKSNNARLIWCTAPHAEVLMPAYMLQSFKHAIGALSQLAGMPLLVGSRALFDPGSLMTPAELCSICYSERLCRTSKIGITLCARSSDGAIGCTMGGHFTHVHGLAATMVRIDDDDDEEAAT